MVTGQKISYLAAADRGSGVHFRMGGDDLGTRFTNTKNNVAMTGPSRCGRWSAQPATVMYDLFLITKEVGEFYAFSYA